MTSENVTPARMKPVLPSPRPGFRRSRPRSREACHLLRHKTPGLQLRVSATGVKTFSVYRRLKAGEPERVTLGRFRP